MDKIIKIIIALSIIVFFAISITYGQPFDPPDGSGGGPINGPVGAPIDGGISALIAAGIALVGRKYFKGKKDKKEEQ